MQTHFYQASMGNGAFEALTLDEMRHKIVEYYAEWPTYEPGNAAPQVDTITHFTDDTETELDVDAFNRRLAMEFEEAVFSGDCEQAHVREIQTMRRA